ncbi:MAG: hypothetical protein R3230_00785 [Nitrosopumilaceae archaeon]|nr:hypothetical protein [Nitrosopumilaceae archaeon]
MSNRSKIDQQLDKFIGIETDIESQIDELDDEDDQVKMHEIVVYEPVESKVPLDQRESDLYDDYEYSRTVLRGILERGTTALENSLMLARESQHPRAFEVTSTLMKNISDTTKDLMNLHSQFSSAGKDAQPSTVNNTQNNYYSDGKPQEKGVDDLLDDLEDDDKKK